MRRFDRSLWRDSGSGHESGQKPLETLRGLWDDNCGQEGPVCFSDISSPKGPYYKDLFGA